MFGVPLTTGHCPQPLVEGMKVADEESGSDSSTESTAENSDSEADESCRNGKKKPVDAAGRISAKTGRVAGLVRSKTAEAINGQLCAGVLCMSCCCLLFSAIFGLLAWQAHTASAEAEDACDSSPIKLQSWFHGVYLLNSIRVFGVLISSLCGIFDGLSGLKCAFVGGACLMWCTNLAVVVWFVLGLFSGVSANGQSYGGKGDCVIAMGYFWAVFWSNTVLYCCCGCLGSLASTSDKK